MPAVPVLPAVTGGVYPTSSISALVAVVNFQMFKPVAQLYSVAVQSVPSGAATPLTYDTERIDNDPDGIGGHSTSVNTSRFTARYPGWYRISGRYTYAANATGFRGVAVGVNGTQLPDTFAVGPTPSAGLSGHVATSGEAFLNVNDYAELLAQQTSGGGLNTDTANAAYCAMTVEFVRAT